MIEFEAVLTRPEQLAATGLTIGETNDVLDAVVAVAEPIQLHFLWRPRLKDPADEMVLETAVNGRADRLVTFNLRRLKGAAEAFGIRVVTPPEAWKEIQRDHAKKNNVALRLQSSLLEEARKVSETEGVALNQFINVAVAEKLSALRTEEYFRERASRANLGKVKRILKRAGKGTPPVAGDEIE
jgi:predicted nucleic acid-binding protein